MKYELKPSYDSAKSFYKKAYIIQEDNKIKLLSYQTIVCEIINNKPLVYGTYSNTTLRHIKEFLKQHGFKADNSKQILKDYSPNKEEIKQKEEETEHKFSSLFNSIKMLGAMSDIMYEDKKDSNDFKARILKAGLENKGLIMPEDWDILTEEEKEIRLNKAYEVLK